MIHEVAALLAAPAARLRPAAASDDVPEHSRVWYGPGPAEAEPRGRLAAPIGVSAAGCAALHCTATSALGGPAGMNAKDGRMRSAGFPAETSIAVAATRTRASAPQFARLRQRSASAPRRCVGRFPHAALHANRRSSGAGRAWPLPNPQAATNCLH